MRSLGNRTDELPETTYEQAAITQSCPHLLERLHIGSITVFAWT